MTTPMKDRIHKYANTDDINMFYFNRVTDCFTNKMDWYDNDDVDMIVVDATNTSQETDNIFSFLYQPELNTDIDEFLFNLERLHNDNTNT